MKTRAISFLCCVLMTSACRGVPKEASPRTRDLERAVSLANAALEERPGSGEMVAVGARQVIDDGRYVWIVTFKLARLLPADPSQDIAGLGGELRARVDLESGGVVIGGGD